MTPLIAGLLAIGLPLLVFGLFFLSRFRPVLLMYLGACAIGLGYLTTTGAVEDVGAKLLGVTASKSAAPPVATKSGPQQEMPSEYPTK